MRSVQEALGSIKLIGKARNITNSGEGGILRCTLSGVLSLQGLTLYPNFFQELTISSNVTQCHSMSSYIIKISGQIFTLFSHHTSTGNCLTPRLCIHRRKSAECIWAVILHGDGLDNGFLIQLQIRDFMQVSLISVLSQ